MFVSSDRETVELNGKIVVAGVIRRRNKTPLFRGDTLFKKIAVQAIMLRRMFLLFPKQLKIILVVIFLLLQVTKVGPC